MPRFKVGARSTRGWIVFDQLRKRNECFVVGTKDDAERHCEALEVIRGYRRRKQLADEAAKVGAVNPGN